MKALLNCFGRTATHVNSDGYVVFDSSAYGTYSVGIGAGIYRIVLIGGGGGGAHCRYGAGHSIFNYYAQGGVAATFDGYVQVTKDSTLTITLGKSGTTSNSMDAGQVSVYGVDGNPSSITGIPGVTLYCGPGTAGKVINGNQGTAGTMGSATISGANILRIDMNSNDHPITSVASAGVRNNLNYATNSVLGRGGGVSGNYVYQGGAPYCLILKVERENLGL